MDPNQVLEAVNAFYSDAFSNLITLTVAVMGLGGVVIPIVVYLIQFSYFRVEQDRIKSQIEDTIKKETEEMRLELLAKNQEDMLNLEKKLYDELTSKLDQKMTAINGGVYHVQGVISLNEKSYGQATVDFVTAATLSIKGKDEMNGRKELNILIEQCLPNLYNSDFDDFDLDKPISSLMAALQTNNENRRFSEEIRAIKSLVKKTREKYKQVVI